MADVSLVIPIYNAGRIVKNTADILLVVFRNLNINYEIIFRDDGSRDDSRRILENLAQSHSQVKCFFNENNRGIGFTLRQLFNDASGEIIVYLDCDLPFGAGIFPLLLKAIRDCDIVVISRYLKKGNRVKFFRRLTSFFYYLFCKILFGLSVRDIGSGTVAFRKKALELLELETNGFDIHGEIFIKSLRKGLRIKEIPATFNIAETGTFSILRHGPAIVADTVKLWFNLKFGKFRGKNKVKNNI